MYSMYIVRVYEEGRVQCARVARLMAVTDVKI
jgi:hypothetical protein